MKNYINREKTIFLLFFIILAGAILRIWGIEFGLPYFHHPDEQRYLIKAIGMLSSLDFNPRYFHNPPFLTYIYGFLVCVYFVVWKIAGIFLNLPGFGELWLNDPTSFYIIARSASVAFGVGTCVIIYNVGKKLFNKPIGLISSVLLSLCFLHIRDSHYAVNDVASVLFMILAFNYIVNVWKDGTTKSYIIAGIISGIAIATKYNTGLIVIPFILAHFFRQEGKEDRGWKRFSIFFVFCFIGFCMCCPWIILDARKFLIGFLWQLRLSKQPWLGASSESAFVQFLKTLFWGYGWIPCLFSVIGGVALAKRKQKFFLLIAFPLIYYILLGTSKLFFVRFVIPLIPFLCILAAFGIVHVSEYFPNSQKNRIIISLTLVAILQGLVFSVRHDYLIGKTDTRIIARDWIRRNIPSGSKIAMDGYSPNIKDFARDESTIGYNSKSFGISLPEKSLNDYRNEGYEFIVTSDFIRKRYTTSPERYRKYSDFYNSLEVDGGEIYSSDTYNKKIPFFLDEVYSPFWNIFILKRPGPCIRIYRIKD